MKSLLRSVAFAVAVAAVGPVLPACDGAEQGEEQNQTSSAGKFETFVGADELTYFQLVAKNGERVLRSEGYSSLSAAKKGISSVKSNAKTDNGFRLIEASGGEFYFNVVAGNGEVVATSETYASKSNARRGIETVKKLLKSGTAAAPSGSAKFATFKGTDGEHYFHLRAANGEIVLQSEGYSSKQNAEQGVVAAKEHGVAIDAYEVVEAVDGQHFFRVHAPNGEIVARGETYASKSNAERGARTVRALLRDLTSVSASDAEVEAELVRAAEGAIYVSESDVGFDFVSAPLTSADKIDEATIRTKLAKFVDENEGADQPMAELFAMESTLEEWRTDYTDCDVDAFPGPAECAELRELLEALDLNLTDVKIFYFGANGEPGSVDGVAVTIFLVGRTPEGNLAGLRTLAIWT